MTGVQTCALPILTALFVAPHAEPLAIVHFDNHPDWVRYPTINCGSWVNRALRSRHVAKVITIEPCSDDLQNPEWKFANLPAMREGRFAVYPWRGIPTKLWGAPVVTPSTTTADGLLTWRNLAGESWSDFLDELVEGLDVPALWITIDKDVLLPAEAITNWDQGEMVLDHIIAAVQRLASSFKIVGVDVCGNYSRPQLKDPLRAFLSWSDHLELPPHDDDDLAVNDRTNARLVAAFREVLQ